MKLMKISQKGLDLIKQFEGLRLEAYRCPAGVWTIGFGSTYGVKQGMKITKAQAEEMLKRDVRSGEIDLNMMGVNFRQCQFDALCSFIYNLGSGNFAKSTLKKYIKEGRDDAEIAAEFVKWVNAGGKPLAGLKRRRVAEANMFVGYELYYLDGSNNIKKR